METMTALYSTEYQLLEIYHENRKTRSTQRFQKFPESLVVQGWSPRNQQARPLGPAPLRVPASAKAALSEVADTLSGIVQSIPHNQNEVVTDCESDVIQRLVEILKECGDKLDVKIQKDQELLSCLQGLSYNLFAKLASAFVSNMMPLSKQQEEDDNQKIKIAWTFEMTSRLTALDLQPMNRAMGFGAQYVQQNFAQWIQQHGGWENAFKINGNDEVQ